MGSPPPHFFLISSPPPLFFLISSPLLHRTKIAMETIRCSGCDLVTRRDVVVIRGDSIWCDAEIDKGGSILEAMMGRKQRKDQDRHGNALLEVFQIVYLGNDDIEPEDQIGTIKLVSHHDVQYLYNTAYTCSFIDPSIRSGDQIMVTVNSPTIRCGLQYFDFDLFNHAYKDTIVIDWEKSDFRDEPTFCEKRIRAQDGRGAIAVYFGLFPYARVADIEVLFLDNSIEFAHGVVAASNSSLLSDLPHSESVLFYSDADHPICPEFQTSVPLSKSRVAVPLDTTLYVEFRLKCDGELCHARLGFECQKNGVFFLLDPSEKIKVQVTWGGDSDSIISTYNDKKEGLRWW